MYEITCPICDKPRTVKDWQSWMKEQTMPYIKACKSCSQKGKIRTEEHKHNLSIATKKAQTSELREAKSAFMKSRPDLHIKTPRPDLGQKAWRGQHQSDEAKQKISEGVKQAAKNKKGTNE